MKNFAKVLALSVLFLACKNQKQPTPGAEAATKDSLQPAASFFPVTDFIGGQIKMVDSLHPPLSKSTTVNNKTIQEALSDDAFKQLAANFLQPDFRDSMVRKKYKETNIADQSIPSVTLIYAATDTSLPVQKINVFIKPSPVMNDKVASVYFEKYYMDKDTLVSQKLIWKTDKNFQINTEKKIAGKVLPPVQIKVRWDPSE